MSLNTADANRAVLLHSGEYILLHCKHTTWDFWGNQAPEFEGVKSGHTYLTSHRMVFRNRSEADLLFSLSLPFVALRKVNLDGNLLSGLLHAQSNGNFHGYVKFNVNFDQGGAQEFTQALVIASCIAVRKEDEFPLLTPPYSPATAWYEASFAAYQRPKGYSNWIPKHEAFTDPRPNSVYITDDPPPYPGIKKLWCKCDPLVPAVDKVSSFSPMDGDFPFQVEVKDDEDGAEGEEEGLGGDGEGERVKTFKILCC